jgi:hypothetical protein
MYSFMPIFIFTIRTRLLNIGSFVGVFVLHTQLKASSIIKCWRGLHFQSCH